MIETLAKCKQGMTRKEISTHLNLKSGGTLTKVLRELINCDFVRGYNTREKKIKQKDQIYQLIRWLCFRLSLTLLAVIF